jgi:phage replication O-like protein O
MANPQKENGYTPIANEILEKIISSGLNGTEKAVILHILRKTYGFQKKEDEISLSQFMVSIPVSRQTLCSALEVLQLVKIVRLVKKGNSKKASNLWAFNKNYDEWQLVKKAKLVKKISATSQVFHKQLVKKTRHTKEILQNKDTKEILHLADAKMPSEFYSILLGDKQKHIRIIGLFLKGKGIEVMNKEQCSSLIKRNLRPAKDLVGYEEKRIEEVIGHLNNNADYKWTLETVGKFIDEDLSRLKVGGKVKSDSDLLREIINSK